MSIKIEQALLAASLILLAGSCQKTLDLDYDNRTPLLAVEGGICNTGVKVTLRYTTNMKDSMNRKGVPGATVLLSGSDGYSEQLSYGDGYYYSPTNAKGTPGVTYSLQITKNDTVITAQSTMPRIIPLDSVKFTWMHIINDVYMRMCRAYYQDNTSEDNYYFLGISRDGDMFNWMDYTDENWSSLFNYQLSGLMMKNEWEDAEKEKKNNGTLQSDILYVGDKVKIEMRTLDKATYHYFYTAGLNTNNGVDPESNLSGKGCVGYFSAYGTSSISLIYNNEDDVNFLP